MKKKLLIFLLGAVLTSVCVGCGAENATNEQTKSASEAVIEESTPEQTIEQAETPKETVEQALETMQEPEPTVEPKPTEEPTPEPTTEPVPEPQVIYTYTDITATMYAAQTVNVRNLPSTDGEKIGSLSTNQEITVLGQCNETNWYMFDYEGQTAFVSNDYLSIEKVEVAPQTNETSTTADNNEAFPYELHVMYYDNMGYPYYYYIGLNKLYISPEDDAKNMACQDAQSNYVFEHFSLADGSCSLNKYWGPVGSYERQGDPIYVQYIYECNGVVLPTPEERGIFTAGLGW